jgi:hypothetical protein
MGWIQSIGLGALLLTTSTLAADGDMYRWVDAQGQVHYSDELPPKDARDVKFIRSERAGSTPEQQEQQAEDSDENDAEPSYIEQNAAFEERQAQKAENQAKAEEKKKAEDERKKNCELAKGNYNTVTTGGRVMRTNAKGDREYLSDEDIQKATAEARQSVEQWCGKN